MENFGDDIVYVDESGDHSLQEVDPSSPVFVLAFCIFRVKDYVQHVVPTIEEFKFEFFGHDMVVLHEHEIRKSQPPFDLLLNSQVRTVFMERLSGIIETASFTVVACVIDKVKLKQRTGATGNPYHVALEFGLERVFMEIQNSQRGRPTHIIFESRGKKEDIALELEFRRIMDATKMTGMADTLVFRCAHKQANSSGLQLADMVARPIGIKTIRPEQPNRAWEILEPKLRRSRSGQVKGFGLKIYP